MFSFLFIFFVEVILFVCLFVCEQARALGFSSSSHCFLAVTLCCSHVALRAWGFERIDSVVFFFFLSSGKARFCLKKNAPPPENGNL